MRARDPEAVGHVGRGGVNLFYEVYGDGVLTVVLMPTFPIVHSRMWKAQIPFLARSFRVVTFDPRGNGRSDRPTAAAAYADDEYVADTMAVMDATQTDRAVLVGLCTGARWSLEVAGAHPERVAGLVAIAPSMPALAPPHPFRARAAETFDQVVEESEGWAARENRHYWLRDFPGWVAHHSGEAFMLPEPHSTKLFEDLVSWGLQTDPETILRVRDAPPGALFPATEEDAMALCRRIACPVLVIHGTEDRCQPLARGERMAELTGGRLVVLEGAGHAPMGRHPVTVNLLIKDFLHGIRPPSAAPVRWTVARNRPVRVLYLSSPIGLGHARRDAAIAAELRRLRPGLDIVWLTQEPVTRVLKDHGERLHPASGLLANESAHVESEAGEHDIRVFQAIRRMDEILVANFMVFHDLVSEERFDLVVGDESWEVDHFWHENPELKRAPFVWLTDFVGWVPMAEGGEHEAFLTADYNAEMLEHVARYPRVRDRAIFVGNPEDVVPLEFGPGLPGIARWTADHFDFSGYVTGFDPARLGTVEALRAELGFGPEEKVCVVTAGGSGVGHHLLRKVMAAYPEAKALVPELRMIVVAGPRIDPRSLPSHDGMEVRGYVDGLYRHLAACDLAVVQGGLTTCMELTAAKRPFLYFPLAGHFEQNVHVRHRLERYGAGRRMDYGSSTPEIIAQAMAEEVGRPVRYLDVETDGAARAAALISALL